MENAKAEGYQVLNGVVRIFSAAELEKFQGVDVGMGSTGGTYAILVLDSPSEISGIGADGSGERSETADLLGMAEHTEYESFLVEYGDLDMWKDLDGQHATVAVLAGDVTFPSDVRLPLGQPSATDVTLLS